LVEKTKWVRREKPRACQQKVAWTNHEHPLSFVDHRSQGPEIARLLDAGARGLPPAHLRVRAVGVQPRAAATGDVRRAWAALSIRRPASRIDGTEGPCRVPAGRASSSSARGASRSSDQLRPLLRGHRRVSATSPGIARNCCGCHQWASASNARAVAIPTRRRGSAGTCSAAQPAAVPGTPT
jgi:hypothetical protein